MLQGLNIRIFATKKILFLFYYGRCSWMYPLWGFIRVSLFLLNQSDPFQQKPNWKPCPKASECFALGSRAADRLQHHKTLWGNTFFPFRKLRDTHVREIFGPGDQIKFNSEQTLWMRGASRTTIWIYCAFSDEAFTAIHMIYSDASQIFMIKSW